MKTPCIKLSHTIKCIVTSLFIVCAPLNFYGCSDEVDYTFFASIAGSVVDADTGEPISNVGVTLTPSNKSLHTGPSGSFEFSNLDIQKYTLVFQKAGYKTEIKHITLTAGEVARVDVLLTKIPQ